MEQLCENGNCRSKCRGGFEDHCDVKCLPSWYPKAPRRPVRELVAYVCGPRHEDGS
eukprot:COSAG06_NODE_41621_length_389_cov_1.151724_1_plen_55_part_01